MNSEKVKNIYSLFSSLSPDTNPNDPYSRFAISPVIGQYFTSLKSWDGMTSKSEEEYNDRLSGCLFRNTMYLTTADFLGLGYEYLVVNEAWYSDLKNLKTWMQFIKKIQDANMDDRMWSPRTIRQYRTMKRLNAKIEDPNVGKKYPYSSLFKDRRNIRDELDIINKETGYEFENIMQEDTRLKNTDFYRSLPSIPTSKWGEYTKMIQAIWETREVDQAIDPNTYGYSMKKYYGANLIEDVFPNQNAAIFFLKFLREYYVHVVSRYNAFGKELSKLLKAQSEFNAYAKTLLAMMGRMIQDLDAIDKSHVEWKINWNRIYDGSVNDIYRFVSQSQESQEMMFNALVMCMDYAVSPFVCSSLFHRMTGPKSQTWVEYPILPPTYEAQKCFFEFAFVPRRMTNYSVDAANLDGATNLDGAANLVDTARAQNKLQLADFLDKTPINQRMSIFNGYIRSLVEPYYRIRDNSNRDLAIKITNLMFNSFKTTELVKLINSPLSKEDYDKKLKGMIKEMLGNRIYVIVVSSQPPQLSDKLSDKLTDKLSDKITGLMLVGLKTSVLLELVDSTVPSERYIEIALDALQFLGCNNDARTLGRNKSIPNTNIVSASSLSGPRTLVPAVNKFQLPLLIRSPITLQSPKTPTANRLKEMVMNKLTPNAQITSPKLGGKNKGIRTHKKRIRKKRIRKTCTRKKCIRKKK
jgi:hypothetical protein